MAEATWTPLPPAEAIKAFEAKGYRVGFDWRDVWEAEHARSFTIAKMTQVDLLAEVHRSLTTALTDGQSFDQWRKGLEPLLKARGWWGRQAMTDPATGETRMVQLGSPRRLQIIFDVNMRQAQAAGHWERIQRVKAARPYLRYVAVLDGRTRDDHRAWHGTILPVDDPWFDTHSPPCGWRCRCTLQQLSAKDLERNGWAVSDPPPTRLRDWTNARTGEVMSVPEGVDPGFAYHKGKAAEAAAAVDRAQILDKLEAAPPEVARAVVKQMVEHPGFEAAATGARPGQYPVAVLDRGLAERIGASGQVVHLSSETAAKQVAHHPEVKPADYQLVQDALDKGEIIKDGDQNLVFVLKDGEWWHAVVKATRSGKGLYLTSWRRTTEADLARARRRGTVINRS